jgi:hypothetical protein
MYTICNFFAMASRGRGRRRAPHSSLSFDSLQLSITIAQDTQSSLLRQSRGTRHQGNTYRHTTRLATAQCPIAVRATSHVTDSEYRAWSVASSRGPGPGVRRRARAAPLAAHPQNREWRMASKAMNSLLSLSAILTLLLELPLPYTTNYQGTARVPPRPRPCERARGTSEDQHQHEHQHQRTHALHTHKYKHMYAASPTQDQDQDEHREESQR